MEMERHAIEVVSTTIEQMPLKYKLIALLWYFEEFSVLDISNILNIPREIVEIRINKVESMVWSQIIENKDYSVKTNHSQVCFEAVSMAFELIVKNYQMPQEIEDRIYGNILGECFS